MDAFDFDSSAERLGRERSGADTMEAIQLGARGVNVVVGMTRYSSEDAGIPQLRRDLPCFTEDDCLGPIRAGSEYRFLRLGFERRPS